MLGDGFAQLNLLLFCEDIRLARKLGRGRAAGLLGIYRYVGLN
jgi:hypothetical protein